jgi:DNA-binding transcriptional LysR family regulator
MNILLSVIDSGSLSAAGRKLGIPLPTVSRKLSDLEDHLKTRLLVRSTRSLALTDAGRAFVAAAKRILEEVGEAERAAAGEYATPRGELVLTAPVTFGRLHVVPVVCEFLAQFPDIDVRISLSDRNIQLIDEHIDLAVRIGALPDSAMIATRVGQVRRVVCGSPSYFAGHGTPKEPGDLTPHSCITFDVLSSSDVWTFPQSGAKAAEAITIRSRLAVNTAEAAIDAAIAGLGVTRVLSYQVASAVKQRTLTIALTKFEPPPLPVHLVHAAQGLLPLKMRRFLEFAVPRLKQRLGASAVS